VEELVEALHYRRGGRGFDSRWGIGIFPLTLRPTKMSTSSGVPRNFFGGSTNSVEDRGQIERGSGGGSPLVRGSTRFEND
jgi:hypothetical protein